MNWRYELSLVPEWCRLPPEEHQDGVGGCWGISHGFVQARGLAYCSGCEFCSQQEPSASVPEE